MWHYNRVGIEYKYDFINRCSLDFANDATNHSLDFSLFSKAQQKKVKDIIDDPILFYFMDCYERDIQPQISIDSLVKKEKALEISLQIAKNEIENLKKIVESIENSKAHRMSLRLHSIPKIFRKDIQCIKKNGAIRTFRAFIKKIFKI